MFFFIVSTAIPTALALISNPYELLSSHRHLQHHQITNTLPKRSCLFSYSPKDGSSDEMDIEAARERLENLMNHENISSPPTRKNKVKSPLSSSPPRTNFEHVPPPPPMTKTARERRKTEIRLLESLQDSDNALSDLWALWFAERGAGPAADLLTAEELAGRGPNKWAEAEERLRDLIDEHGVHWVEPVNRLATLLYQQGRLHESKVLCEVVLSIKPWHFGALSGIVLVCAGMGDSVNARIWADRRLPPLQLTETNERREVWVKRAVDEAMGTITNSLRLERNFGGAIGDDRLGLYPNSSDDSWQ